MSSRDLQSLLTGTAVSLMFFVSALYVRVPPEVDGPEASG